MSKSPKRKKEDYAYPARREGETNERASFERARTRACSYAHSLARIILVDGAPAGSINSSVLLYPVEGEITLEIITG